MACNKHHFPAAMHLNNALSEWENGKGEPWLLWFFALRTVAQLLFVFQHARTEAVEEEEWRVLLADAKSTLQEDEILT